MNWISVEEMTPKIGREVLISRCGKTDFAKIKKSTPHKYYIWQFRNGGANEVKVGDHWCEITEPSE